jgi:tRNA U34 5-methylaminomethyl-2-thiouridine-forming methyltransferase MnmC
MPEGAGEVQWRAGGVPVSSRFDDPYFSLEDGFSETHHVFLAGNDLPARFKGGFQVAELGFGTGLNLLATLACWRAAGVPGRFRFTSFEAWPLSADDMARALAAFPEARALADPLLDGWARGQRRIALPEGDLEVIEGDARATLPEWTGRADAWFLDGFAPAKNPELWAPELLAEVARHTAPGGTAATYTAAGHVRRALQAAGFAVTRAPGYGRKRHMTRAVLEAET